MDNEEIIDPQSEEEIGEEDDEIDGVEESLPDIPKPVVGDEEARTIAEGKIDEDEEDDEEEDTPPADSTDDDAKGGWVGGHTMGKTHPSVPPPSR